MYNHVAQLLGSISILVIFRLFRRLRGFSPKIVIFRKHDFRGTFRLQISVSKTIWKFNYFGLKDLRATSYSPQQFIVIFFHIGEILVQNFNFCQITKSCEISQNMIFSHLWWLRSLWLKRFWKLNFSVRKIYVPPLTARNRFFRSLSILKIFSFKISIFPFFEK